MLLPFNAHRLRLCLLREKESLVRALGRKRQAHDKAWEKARQASDYLRQADRVLISQGLPAAWDVGIQPTNTYRPGVVRVEMTLDGAGIGHFLVDDDWPFRYCVADKRYLFFSQALRAAGRYLARQVAYYQLLRRRLQPFTERVHEEANRRGPRCPLVVSTHYHCEEQWQVKFNHLCLCLSLNSKNYELRIYGDRYLWDADGEATRRPLFTEQEMMQALDQALRANVTPAGSRAFPEWLLLFGARVRRVIHLR